MKSVTFLLLICLWSQSFSQDFSDVAVGKKAVDFSVKTIQGDEVNLNRILKNNPVVLVVLRGWPGYQCPVCTKQVGGLVADADKITKSGAVVLMVYPGPSEELQQHAKEFSEDFSFPDNFYFTIDPDFSMINKYRLRWDAPRETAYPTTLVISKSGEIVFSRTSTTHGGRASNEEIFQALEKF